MKRFIALMTDFGLDDAYVGEMKGVIYGIQPDAAIVDLTHGIGPQQVLQGAMILESSYALFPKGSIFVCVVDPGVGTSRKILCAQSGRYAFIGPDNGLLSLAAARERAVKIRSVENRRYFRPSVSTTFQGRDIMSPVAAHLARADIFAKLGPAVRRMHTIQMPAIRRVSSKISGEILFFDHFGNALTNIRRSDLGRAARQKAEIFAGGKNLGGLKKTYGSSDPRLCAVINSAGQLELALPGGSAKTQAHLKKGMAVEICF